MHQPASCPGLAMSACQLQGLSGSLSSCLILSRPPHAYPAHPQKGDLTTKFQPFSRYPPCYKDMAFWISPEFSENNLCELVGPFGSVCLEFSEHKACRIYMSASSRV